MQNVSEYHSSYPELWKSSGEEERNVVIVLTQGGPFLLSTQGNGRSVLEAKGSDGQHRRAVIDQVVATALPEATDPEAVTNSARACSYILN